jgi:hypothetical protein
LVLVLLNGDQSLAAEPGFHGHSPERGDSAVIILRHASDHPPKLFEQQPENDLALAQGPTQTLGVVMEGVLPVRDPELSLQNGHSVAVMLKGYRQI